MSTLAELVVLAKYAEQGERFDEMVDYMKQAVQFTEDVEPDVRNLLSVAYKNIVGSRRSALRILGSIKDREEARDLQGFKLQAVLEYKQKLEGELDAICMELQDKVLNESMLNKVTQVESRVFFRKMKGDYYRYMAEYKEGKSLKEVCEVANEWYSKALELAEAELSYTSAIRLGLVLNYSVFYYEIMNEPKKALDLAQSTFDLAKDQESDDDSALILQLLRDNLSLWANSSDQTAGNPDDDVNEL